MKLQLIKQEQFGDLKIDLWKNNNSQDNEDYYFTREQIGKALGCADPHRDIAKIHKRHKERLDIFSLVDKMTTNGKHYKRYLYNVKGVYEICRWSKQKKANDFISWVWELLEKIRKEEIEFSIKSKFTKGRDVEWHEQRAEGKVIRKEFTDLLQGFVKYAEQQESKNAGWYPSLITGLIQKALFKFKSLKKAKMNLRDYLDTHQISKLTTCEIMAMELIMDLMNRGLPYKDIYILLKDRVVKYQEIIGCDAPRLLPNRDVKVIEFKPKGKKHNYYGETMELF